MPDAADFVRSPDLAACALFVFHDGGPGRRSALDTAAAQIEPVDLAVTVVDRVVRPGDVKARNRAIANHRGSYIAVIDGPAAPNPDWLAASVATLRDDPTIGLVAPGADDDPRSWVIDPTASVFVARRSMWQATGGFDDGVGPAAQGLSLGWRCWMLGWRAVEIGSHGAALPAPPAPRPDVERLAATLLRAPGPSQDRADRSRRRALQALRRRTDAELGPLLTDAIERGRAAAEVGVVLTHCGADHILRPRRSILVATADTLAPTMAGPGIRAWKIAEALSASHDVHLVTSGLCSLTDTPFPVERVDHDRFAALVETADVVLFQGWVMADRPYLANSDTVIIADIYDPMHFEQLEHGRDAAAEGGRWDAVAGANHVLNQQLRRGDYFLCASVKQRDLWLGQLAANGRINSVLYDEDHSLATRVRIVPFGVDDAEPSANRRAIRDEVPEIALDDDVILWGGGIYNWFDPLTLIRAVDRLRRRRPTVRLYFLGTRHPNPGVPEMRMAVAARDLAEELGLAGTHVFFNDGWVPYEERADYLLDADVAVSIHGAHIETEFSFRTRLLDYLWCGLPIVATAGDSFEPLIEAHGLGTVVPPGDVAALEDALETLLADPDRRAGVGERAQRLADEFRWNRVLEPIREICRHPTRAPDVACPDTAPAVATGQASRWRRAVPLARRYLTEGGPGLLFRWVRTRISRTS